MSKIMWINEYERIEEDLTSGVIDDDEARDRLRHLGFDRGEVEDHIAALQKEMGYDADAM